MIATMYTHYADVPRVALCGEDLTADNYKLFYDNTSNAFASVTCAGCRAEIKRTILVPQGFPDPLEWSE